MKVKYFIQQSIKCPYWWENIGCGSPRTLWLKFTRKIIYPIFKKRENPIHSFYWWTNREKIGNETAILAYEDGLPHPLYLSGKFKPYKIPFYKSIFIKLFTIIK